MRNQHHRSAVNRAYFAVFAALTARLIEGNVKFGPNREAPPHGDPLYAMIKRKLPMLSKYARREVFRLTKTLYLSRCSADYTTRTRFESAEAKECFNQASLVFRHLGVWNDE